MKPILLDLPQTIRTPRFFLRPPAAGDGREMNAAIMDSLPELQEWMPWARPAPSVLDSEEYVRAAYARAILREEMTYIIFDAVTGKIAGSSGFHAIDWNLRKFEIGYWRRTNRAGEGVITEAVNALTRFAFGPLGAMKVEIRCNAGNRRSAEIPKRLNFEMEAHMRHADRFALEAQSRDILVFSRLDLVALPGLNVSW